jgi:hypothetical protein
VRATFAPQLRGRPPELVVDLLVVALDVYTWKILRRDRGLERAEAQERMVALVEAVVGEKGA